MDLIRGSADAICRPQPFSTRVEAHQIMARGNFRNRVCIEHHVRVEDSVAILEQELAASQATAFSYRITTNYNAYDLMRFAKPLTQRGFTVVVVLAAPKPINDSDSDNVSDNIG